MNIKISLRSQQLIKKYRYLTRSQSEVVARNVPSSVDLDTLLFWLNEEQTNLSEKSKKKRQEIDFILVSLRTELLHDLLVSMTGNKVKIDKEQAQMTSMASKIKFALLAIAGILVAACQGFDGIVTMLGIFTLSPMIVLWAGLAFSLLSILIFCQFNLVQLSNSLGIQLSDSYKLLDVYLLQLHHIKALRKKIDDYNLADCSQHDLKELVRILSMLQKRFASLTQTSKQFNEVLNTENIQLVKTLMSYVSAFLFFGGGFFAGQSVALFISGLIIHTVIPAFWPVIVFSTLVGLAALGIYWYIERPGLNKLVSTWFGLDEENVRKLCDEELLVKESKKLGCLKEKITSMAKQNNKLTQLEQEIRIISTESRRSNSALETGARLNVYSFLQSSEIQAGKDDGKMGCQLLM